jgi:hypothetical protein
MKQDFRRRGNEWNTKFWSAEKPQMYQVDTLMIFPREEQVFRHFLGWINPVS